MKRAIRNSLATGLAFVALAGTAFAQSSGIDIVQVPANSTRVGNEESTLKASDQNVGGDYQNQIMNDPTVNDRARAEAAMNASNGTTQDADVSSNISAVGGNTAVIVQHGNANKSSVTQIGNNNNAQQTQTGNHNDLRIEQTGNNNSSVENQTGNYNHKVKIQNGHESDEETTDMEEASPAAKEKQ